MKNNDSDDEGDYIGWRILIGWQISFWIAVRFAKEALIIGLFCGN